MKILLLALTAAGLTGCAVYPAPGYEQPYYGGVAAPSAYVVEQPVYLYGGGVYRADNYPRYRQPAPIIVPQRPPPRFGNGDRNHDGIPDRAQRNGDRNHDGVPDRQIRNRDGDRDGDGIPDRLERNNPNEGLMGRIKRRMDTQ